MIEIPLGWQKRPLKDVCIKILGGGTPSTKIPDYWKGNIPWISSADIKGIKNINPTKYISKEAVENSTTNVLSKGGIIIVTRVGLGKLAIAPYDIAFSQDNQGLILNEAILDKSYALIYLSLAVKKFKTESRGTTISGVTKKQLNDLDIVFPSLEEQHLIVQKIEEFFTELDKGVEQLKTAQQQLKVYRQAVLKWAFEGKLTNEHVKDGELPEGWEWKKLGEYLDRIESGKSYKCDERQPKDDEIGIIKVSSVTWGEFNEQESKTCYSLDLFNEKYVINAGDFLFSRANTLDLVGACVIVKMITKRLMLSDKILRFVFTDKILDKYILYFLRSQNSRRQIKDLSTGNQESMRNIGQEKIRNIKIPFCDLKFQKEIVNEIESRLSVCDKIEETISAGLQQTGALRQSILKRSFEGKLM